MAHRSEEKRRRKDRPRVAASKQRDGDRIEAIADRERRWHVMRNAEDLIRTGEARKGARDAHRQHEGPGDRDPGGASSTLAEADRADPEADRGPLQQRSEER